MLALPARQLYPNVTLTHKVPSLRPTLNNPSLHLETAPHAAYTHPNQSWYLCTNQLTIPTILARSMRLCVQDNVQGIFQMINEPNTASPRNRIATRWKKYRLSNKRDWAVLYPRRIIDGGVRGVDGGALPEVCRGLRGGIATGV